MKADQDAARVHEANRLNEDTNVAPKFCFLDRVVMSPETFAALKAVCSRPESIQLPSGTVGKAMIARADGRTCWHTVERQEYCGTSYYYASPIVVRAYRAEAA